MTHTSEASSSPWISHHELLSIRKLMLIVHRRGKEPSQQCFTEELSQLSHTPRSQRQAQHLGASATRSGLTLLPSLYIQRGIELRKLSQMKNAMGFKLAFKKAKSQTTLAVAAGKTHQVRQAEIIPFPAMKYFAERPRFPTATPSKG